MTIENTLAPFISGYRRRHPGIEVQLVEDGGVRLRTRLAGGDVQVALTVVLGERFRHRPLYPAYGVAVMSRRHSLARRRTVEVTELAAEPLLLLHRAFASRDWIDRACDAAHIRPHILLESAAPHTIIALARAEHGIAIVPSTVAIAGKGVHAAPLTHHGKSIGQWLMAGWDAHRFLAPFAEVFIDELATYCARSHPGKEFTRRAPLLPRPEQATLESA